ncbi:hypothetical protein F4780DRAFT_727176 [Xylariomycetidae sp. FL0641]|nr:hypothetical protein F4780DRAFT_727176 [Xylariomycetidae sp. FL0641]
MVHKGSRHHRDANPPRSDASTDDGITTESLRPEDSISCIGAGRRASGKKPKRTSNRSHRRSPSPSTETSYSEDFEGSRPPERDLRIPIESYPDHIENSASEASTSTVRPRRHACRRRNSMRDPSVGREDSTSTAQLRMQSRQQDGRIEQGILGRRASGSRGSHRVALSSTASSPTRETPPYKEEMEPHGRTRDRRTYRYGFGPESYGVHYTSENRNHSNHPSIDHLRDRFGTNRISSMSDSRPPLSSSARYVTAPIPCYWNIVQIRKMDKVDLQQNRRCSFWGFDVNHSHADMFVWYWFGIYYHEKIAICTGCFNNTPRRSY